MLRLEIRIRFPRPGKTFYRHQSRVLRRQPKIVKTLSSSNVSCIKTLSDEEDEEDEEEKEEQDEATQRVLKKKEVKPFVPTVPQPFEMTVREDKKREERELANQFLQPSEAEKSKNIKIIEHFKAIEMPSHVKEKRYEKLVKKQEKKQTKEEIYLEMKDKIKPFSFVLREEKKALKRSNSSPNLKCTNCKTEFQANPFPASLFTDFAQEQKQERENYREIQRKLRQEILLKNSAYPPRMGSEFIKKKLQENKELAARANKTKPRGVRRERTDLDRLYREYRDNLEKKQTRQTDRMVVLTERAELHQRENKIKHRNQSRETAKKRPRSAEGNLSVKSSYNLTTQLRLKLLEENQLREGFNLDKKKQQMYPYPKPYCP